jgi:hypothetical protein
LPAESFDATETAAPRVDAKSLVTVRQNRYSVPVALAGLKVHARIGAREITINHGGAVVARHERLHGKFGTSAQLDHYLELLVRKPGGLERGAWPACFDELWGSLTARLRALGGGAADGRRPAAVPRARTRPRHLGGPRRAGRRAPTTAAPSRCSPAARRPPSRPTRRR